MRITFAIVCVSVLMLSGCGETDKAQREFYAKERKNVERIERVKTFSYVQDPRTGLCFAVSDLGYPVGIMSHVPCTPEVLREINN